MIITNDFELIAALDEAEAIWSSTSTTDQERLDELVDAIEKYESERFRF